MFHSIRKPKYKNGNPGYLEIHDPVSLVALMRSVNWYCLLLLIFIGFRFSIVMLIMCIFYFAFQLSIKLWHRDSRQQYRLFPWIANKNKNRIKMKEMLTTKTNSEKTKWIKNHERKLPWNRIFFQFFSFLILPRKVFLRNRQWIFPSLIEG